MFLDPAKGPRFDQATRLRARAATRAAAAPAGPAPDDDDSKSVMVRPLCRRGRESTRSRAPGQFGDNAGASLTTARSARGIMGQLGSVLTAITWLGVADAHDVLHRTEMPTARYRSGSISTPVVPIWRSWSIHPASVSTRVAPSRRRTPSRSARTLQIRGRRGLRPRATMRSASARSMVAGSAGMSSTSSGSRRMEGDHLTGATVGGLDHDLHDHPRLQDHDGRR